MMSNKSAQVVATNRRASYDYFLFDTYEAGLVLLGPEIKSVRSGRVHLREAHVGEKGGELWLLNAHIATYEMASRQKHNPVRARKLLLHRREINKLMPKLRESGYTVIPTQMYLIRGFAKVEIAVAKGKRKYDKRQAIAKKEAERAMARAVGRRR